MAASPASASTVSNDSGTACAVPMPSGATPGDFVVVAYIAFTGTSATFNAPSGWTAETTIPTTNGGGGAIFVRQLDGTESWPVTFDVSGVSGANEFAGFAIAVRVIGQSLAGGNASDDAQHGIGASGTTNSFVSVTSTVANDLILMFGFQDCSADISGSQWDNVFPAGTSLFATLDFGVGSGEPLHAGVIYFTQASAGATGAKTCSAVAQSAGRQFYSLSIAIKPATTPLGKYIRGTQAVKRASIY